MKRTRIILPFFKNQSGLGLLLSILVYAVLAAILGGIGFGAYRLLIVGARDNAAAERLEIVSLAVDNIYESTGKGIRGNDLRTLSGDTRRMYMPPEVEVSAYIRAECKMARALSSNPDLTIYIRYNHVSVLFAGDPAAAAGEFGYPFFIEHNEICDNPEIQHNLRLLPSDRSLFALPERRVQSSLEFEAKFPDTNHIWISIFPDVWRKNSLGSGSLGLSATRDFGHDQGNNSVDRGDTIVIGTRSANGNSLCVRKVLDSSDKNDVGDYYQISSSDLLNEYGGSLFSMALCIPIPKGEAADQWTRYGYTKDGFSDAPITTPLRLATCPVVC